MTNNNDTWKDSHGNTWYGYWLTKLDGSWGYLLHHEKADTDMGDMEIQEVEEAFGPLTHENGSMTRKPLVRRQSGVHPTSEPADFSVDEDEVKRVRFRTAEDDHG